MMLNILTDFCNWWWLAWLLPFLLGLLLGWAIWAKYARRARELEDDLARCRSKYNDLEKKLKACNSDKHRLEGDLDLCKSNLSKRQSDITALRAEIENLDKPSISTSTATSAIKAVGIGATPVAASAPTTYAAASPSSNTQPKKDKYAKIKDNNLQLIEGIGPKMEKILQENNVSGFQKLSTMSESEIRTVLDKYGDKYRIIDPSEWSAQAKHAHEKDWEGLIAYQKSDGSDSKTEKTFVKMGIIRAYADNDLKAIEGIGPKIAELLMSNGISTWSGLANTSVDKLKSILESSGSKFKLADPSTWPKQAEMAASGDWDKLEEYQDFLNGGKDYI